MGIFKKKSNPEQVEYWKKDSEYWRAEYKREMLRNNAWANAILKAVLIGVIDHKAQKAIYELQDDEMKSVNKQLIR